MGTGEFNAGGNSDGLATFICFCLTVLFSVPLFVFKKPGKIYCSTFRGHRDSIIKRLVKSYANKEKYKISTMTPKRRAINLSWFFICLCFSKSLLIKCCLYFVVKEIKN